MHRHIIASFIRSWREHATMQSATLAVLTSTFTVITLFVFLHGNMVRILTYWGRDVQLTVFLKDGVKSADVATVKQFLDDSQAFSEVRFVSKDEAAGRFQKQMGTYAPHLFSDPEFGNPLPSSYETRLKNNLDSKNQYDRMVNLAKTIGTLSGVDEVSYGQGWVENYASLLKVISSSSWVLVFIMLGGSLFVVGNSIRNSIYQRRDEIEILELVGATPAMIKLPYIAEGMIMGLGSAALSLAICYGLYDWQRSVVGDNLGFWGLASQVGFLTPSEIFGCLFMGALFGYLGSYLCVRRLASGWAAAEGAER